MRHGPHSSPPAAHPARSTSTLAAVTVGLVVALTGCGTGSTPSAGAPGASASTTTIATSAATAAVISDAGAESGRPTIATSAATDSSTAGAVAPAKGAVSCKEFCAALAAVQPQLDKDANPDGAYIDLSMALIDLYDKKNAVESMDASTMDALTASCPAVAAKALKSTGKSSFAEFR